MNKNKHIKSRGLTIKFKKSNDLKLEKCTKVNTIEKSNERKKKYITKIAK
jgi:hypothetical protein